jgi:hypothetical protein
MICALCGRGGGDVERYEASSPDGSNKLETFVHPECRAEARTASDSLTPTATGRSSVTGAEVGTDSLCLVQAA